MSDGEKMSALHAALPGYYTLKDATRVLRVERVLLRWALHRLGVEPYSVVNHSKVIDQATLDRVDAWFGERDPDRLFRVVVGQRAKYKPRNKTTGPAARAARG